ncbi:hypothetical protein [Longimicrobium sp.]|uniref:hypothetical protein n=1 Tax=Longimicrobium sp. TaxID=2029185 RepID=UPI002C02F936|nr:hypothetical protein [Longimicrobium sp.]HSU14546.1 hypothetical protein [Longimicrobium sp.]
MFNPIRLLLSLAVCASAAAATSPPPALLYAGIPWRVPADSARARLEAQGFTYGREDRFHDLYFHRGDGTLLKAEMQDGRLVGIVVADMARRAAVDPRFAALVDSFTAAHGKPDSVTATYAHWEAGLSELVMYVSFDGAVRHVELDWMGPGELDEMDRRYQTVRDSSDLSLPALPAGYTIVRHTGLARTSVDTARLARRAGGVLHGRFRIEYVRPVGPDSASFDSAEYEMDFDCAQGRTRLAARSMRLHGAVRHADTYNGLPWETPRPDGHYARGLKAACAAASVLRPAR